MGGWASRNSETNKILSLPFSFLPVLPDAVPQSVAQPTIDLLEFGSNTCAYDHVSVLDAIVDRVGVLFDGYVWSAKSICKSFRG